MVSDLVFGIFSFIMIMMMAFVLYVQARTGDERQMGYEMSELEQIKNHVLGRKSINNTQAPIVNSGKNLDMDGLGALDRLPKLVKEAEQ